MNVKDTNAKKSKFHTSAEVYRDIDGNMRKFDFIDHDPKTSIATSGPADKDYMVTYRKSLIDKITNVSASLCPGIFMSYTLRGEAGIRWNITMLQDNGIPIERLQDIWNMMSNKMDLLHIQD